MIDKDAREERKAREARAALAFGCDHRLPEGGLGRVLALWGLTSVPFFRAFPRPETARLGYERFAIDCGGFTEKTRRKARPAGERREPR